MGQQLVLLEDRKNDWQLDDHTREVGRQGVLAARAALREAAKEASKKVAA